MSPFLFADFIKEKRFLNNLSEHTIRSYTFAYQKFKGYEVNKAGINKFVVGLREQNLSAGACNVYIRSINSFLTWCYENGHTSEHLKIRLLKQQKRMIRTFSDAEARAIICYKPKGLQKRLHTLLLLLLDTGLRIDEALSLKRSNLDLENLLLTVVGKGNKERIIPFSIELRKSLFKLMNSHKFELVFCTKHGGKLSYNNARRDFNILMTTLGIETDGTFQAFRRFFATNFIRQNGNTFILQRLLGHTSQAMTACYVKLITDDLSLAHARTSVLSQLR